MSKKKDDIQQIQFERKTLQSRLSQLKFGSYLGLNSPGKIEVTCRNRNAGSVTFIMILKTEEKCRNNP